MHFSPPGLNAYDDPVAADAPVHLTGVNQSKFAVIAFSTLRNLKRETVEIACDSRNCA